MSNRRIAAGLTLAAALTFLPSAPASAQASIKVYIPYAAGGTADLAVRMIGQKVEQDGGPRVLVENKTGGGGVPAALAGKDSPADGSALFLGDLGTLAINVTLMKDLPYDPVKDFKPVAVLYAFPSILSVPSTLPAKSVAELVDLARKKPGGLSYASQGIGSGGHLLGEMLAKASGAPFSHIPYRGVAAALTDLAAGRVDLLFGSYLSAKPFIEDGKLRILAATTRMPALPDVPSMAEAGYPKLDLDVWFGLVAPAGTPDAVVASLNERFVKAIKSPDIVAKLNSQGVSLVTTTPAEMAKVIKEDIARMAPIVMSSGAKVN